MKSVGDSESVRTFQSSSYYVQTPFKKGFGRNMIWRGAKKSNKPNLLRNTGLNLALQGKKYAATNLVIRKITYIKHVS